MSRSKRTTRVRYDKLVPDGSAIGDYLSYLSPLETAYAYDFWTAVWLISVAIGRTTYVNRPGAPVFLNVYAILVAESGITRKSTSVRHATKLARDLCSTNPVLIEDKTTPENLVYRLVKQSETDGYCGAVISISELSTFLGRERYVEALPALLTDLYDCPEIKSGGGSLSRPDQTLRNVFVSFLSASTPSWLLRAVNPDVIEGGFTSRVCFIVSEQPKQMQSWPEPLDERRRLRVQTSLRAIADKSRSVSKIEISDGARRTYDNWYRKRQRYGDPFRSSFQSREDSHILRLAAILSINDGTWVIQHTHIISAIKVITQVREDGASIFEGTGSNSKFIIGIDKIRDKLLAAGINGLPQTDLTKLVAPYMNAEHMRAVLDIMHELGMVSLFEVPPRGRGRPVTLWRGAAPLQTSKAIDNIVSQYVPARD